MFIRADSRLYRSQSSGCHGARRAARIAGLYARDKRATGDPNLRSLHNCRSGGGGDGRRGVAEVGGGEHRGREIYSPWRQKRRWGREPLPPESEFSCGFFPLFFFFLSLRVLVHIRLQYRERDDEAESGVGKKKRFEQLRRPPRGAAVAPLSPYHSQQITQFQTIMCKQLSSLQPLIGSRLILRHPPHPPFSFVLLPSCPSASDGLMPDCRSLLHLSCFQNAAAKWTKCRFLI